MGNKKSIPIKAFWFSDVLVIPKLVTVITTLDDQGRVNAAPYSLGMTYNAGKNSRRS